MAGQPINKHLLECPSCGYQLLGAPTASDQVTCPECGTMSDTRVRRYFPTPMVFVRKVSALWPWTLGLCVAIRAAAWMNGAPASARGASSMMAALFTAFVMMIVSTGLSWRRAVRLRENADDPRSALLAGDYGVFNLLMLTTGLWWLACLAVLCVR